MKRFFRPLLVITLLTPLISNSKPYYDAQNLGAFAISVDLFFYIYDLLEEGATILELGSGTGTAELARYYKMYSIEHEKIWMDKYESTYIYAPIRKYKSFKWYNVDYLVDKLPEQYDLILIDGPPGPIGRYGFYHYMHLFNCNVPIIFDDTHRRAEVKLCQDVARKLNRSHRFIKCSDGKSFGVILPE